jgi:actin-like ATPase involved in cell morphogenesis
MSESLGLSIGVANLVAARAGSDPVTRRSVLTLFDGQPSEVGLLEENPNATESGLVMRGFVERVGDRTPLVASDGTKYLGDALTVEALEVMARSVGYGTPITIAVPAYWSDAQSVALREEFFAQPGLTSAGVAPTLISDATAAFAALRAEPGFPTAGVVALCDFGAGGTTVTLIDAGSDGAQIGPSVRYTDFSGDAIDQLILDRVRDNAPDTDTTGGLSSTIRMGSLTRQRKQCRSAKEQLSTAAVATVALGSGDDVSLSRNEFEELISEPLDQFLSTVEEVLQRNEIRSADLAAVATVGGGASIPLLGARLSERLQVPIHSTPAPAFSAAVGAAVFGDQQPPAPTTAAPVIENPTQLASAAAPDMTQVLPGARIEEDRPLAWSEDPDAEDEPIPYTGPEHSGQYVRDAMEFDEADGYDAEPGRLPWYKRTVLVLGVGGAALALLLLGVVLALTLGHNETPPVTPPSQTTPAPTETPQTVTVTESTTPTTTTPPPPSTTTEAPVTTTAPPVTTTQAPITTTTTTPPTITTTEPPTTRDRPRLFPRWRL